MRLGILQYVPIKVAMGFVTFICQQKGVYGNGQFDFTLGYPYVAFISNCSQIWAMYCLVLFYHAFVDIIAPLRPLAKFMSVKLVVFFTFWQSVLIAFFVKIHFLTATADYTSDEVADGIQDFVICIEMFIAAIAHIYIFPHREFENDSTRPRYGFSLNNEEEEDEQKDGGNFQTQVSRLTQVINPLDIMNDMHKHIIVEAGKQMKSKLGVRETERLTHGFTDSQGYHTYPIDDNTAQIDQQQNQNESLELQRSNSLNELIQQANLTTVTEVTESTSMERPLIY